MAFEDVARRMQERHQGEGLPPLPPTFPSTPHDRGFHEPMMEHLADVQRREARSRGTTDIVFGIILLIVGIGITAATYGGASRQGGTYIVAYGPIVVGVIKLVRGLVRLGSA
ncbi:MAG: hypothetical protein H6Q90_3814 [Deltaproteobacteria bacterium]|nr:hypothetical protein [Deltaproteobacteria bacterium]